MCACACARRRAYAGARVCACARVRTGAGLIVLCTITTYCTLYKNAKKLGKGSRNTPPTP